MCRVLNVARAGFYANSEQHARDLLEAKSELLKLRAPLTRTEEERGILKKAARYFARESD